MGSSFLPDLSLSASAGPSSANDYGSTHYQPINNVVTAGGASGINQISSLLNALNAGNAANGGYADLGIGPIAQFQGPINDSQGVTVGVAALGSNAGFSLSPMLLLAAAGVAIFLLTRR